MKTTPPTDTRPESVRFTLAFLARKTHPSGIYKSPSRAFSLIIDGKLPYGVPVLARPEYRQIFVSTSFFNRPRAVQQFLLVWAQVRLQWPDGQPDGSARADEQTAQIILEHIPGFNVPQLLKYLPGIIPARHGAENAARFVALNQYFSNPNQTILPI